jgi:DNA repair protein RecO (recombination protein O)
LTVLTGSEGKLTLSARGALRKNSKLTAATQLLAFSEMTIYCSRDRWTLTEAGSVEQFIGLRDDIELLALGAYFAELTEAVTDEDSPSQELLPLCLNALFVLSEKIKTPVYVKPAFELRLLTASGFAPLVEYCSICGREDPDRAFLDIAGGTIICGECMRVDEDAQLNYPDTERITNKNIAMIGGGALRAAKYIINCDPKKLFSFSLGDAALRELTFAAERYLLTQLDRSFRTLDYYKGITKYDII